MPYRFLLLAGVCALAFGVRGAVLDNSALLPKYREDSQVKLESSGPEDSATPDWVKSLILVEVNVTTASEDGTFAGMGKVLDHLAETGVNGIWLTPINERPHYGNWGLHTLNRELTGTDDPAEQWKRVRRFVDEAHRRNIRVFFDVVSWGVTRNAPLFREKPEWFTGEFKKEWNGWLWDWTNKELREWFSSRLTDLVMQTGVDGIRCDSAPGFAAYGPYRVARERLHRFGRKPVFLSEHPSERRGVFDFDQLSFMYEGGNTGTRFPCRVFMTENIVDIVKSGTRLGSVDAQLGSNGFTLDGGRERYYSFPLSCHDNRSPREPANLIEFAYQALFSPFIPLWFLGEEWRNPCSVEGWSWPNPVRWELLEQNRGFFEEIKRMIRIRREYPEIFEYFPDDHRQANIGKVETDQPDLLQPYVRWRNGVAILIVPNNSTANRQIKITVPRQETGFGNTPVTVTDLLTGKNPGNGPATVADSFTAEVPAGKIGIYKVVPAN